MHQNEYDKSLEYVKTAVECIKDYQNIKRCEQSVLQFTRENAWQCLQDMIREYWAEINVFGALFDRVIVEYNIDPKCKTDDEIQNQLIYIAQHIPLYVLMRKGEEEWIFPYQENADVMFNSSLFYELAVLKTHAEPILRAVPQNIKEYSEARRLLHLLEYVVPLQDKELPPTSVVREFLGGSSFKY